ncbi:hypothetical protein [Paenibacillus cymbidii]|uniref:hypothetical protein n=1 Tax=Paenibacillus cymbidii TaxID=1639034 RepID=UPI00143676C5|nr:hypothetical protein [Paenibacillus cymbidii]
MAQRRAAMGALMDAGVGIAVRRFGGKFAAVHFLIERDSRHFQFADNGTALVGFLQF